MLTHCLNDNSKYTEYLLSNEAIEKVCDYCDYLTFKIDLIYDYALIDNIKYEMIISNNIKLLNIPINLLNSTIYLYKK